MTTISQPNEKIIDLKIDQRFGNGPVNVMEDKLVEL